MGRRYVIYSDEDILEEALLLVHQEGASTYTVANQLDMPQSTVWKHVTDRLFSLNIVLWLKVQIVLKNNYKGGGR